MEKNMLEHLKKYDFKVGEIVTVGGNPNVLAEVKDISDSVQIAVRILTPPNKGNVIYTTRFTYYTTPVPNITAQEILKKYSSLAKREIKMNEKSVDVQEVNEATVNEKFYPKIGDVLTVIEETFNEEESIKKEDVVFSEEETQPIKIIEDVESNDADLFQLSLF